MVRSQEGFHSNREKGKSLLIKMFYLADRNSCYFKYMDYFILKIGKCYNQAVQTRTWGRHGLS